MLAAAGLPGGRAALATALDDGAAFDRWTRWTAAQGGTASRAEDLAVAPGRETLRASRDGTLGRLDALPVGEAVKALGGGRDKKDDPVDLGVGVELHAKVGDPVEEGEPLITVYHRDGRGLEAARSKLLGAVEVVHEAPARPLVYERLGG
jgi:pyrimidine-nucleoside phosphorylase/thymidine phosphorylase